MANVVIYSKVGCSFCENAKAFFKEQDIAFVIYMVDEDETKFKEMLDLSGGQRTVPQIFIDGQHIGGFERLMELHEQSKLNAMLCR